MFLTRKPIWLIHVGGQDIRTTADHPFFIHGKGWTDTAELQVGDLLLNHDGQSSAIEDITDTGEEEVVYQMGFGAPPFPFTGLWRAGTLLETADGLKAIEDIKPGDYLVVHPPPDADQEPPDEDDHDDQDDDPSRWERN